MCACVRTCVYVRFEARACSFSQQRPRSFSCIMFLVLSYIPANSPSLVRSLRNFRLARISVRGDRNLRHLSMGFFFFSFRFPAIISYFPVIIPISVVGKKQGWHLDEVGRHVQEIQMQEKRRNRTRPTLTPIG